MITCCTSKSMISEGGGRGVIPTNRHVVLCYIFFFCFVSIIVHLYWQEREKKIRHVMCKKLEKPKHLRPEKKNFSISNSRVHVGQQWIKITTLQLLHNVTYPCCHHMIWKDRSIASAYKFLTQKSKPSLISYFLINFLVATLFVLPFINFYVSYHSLCSFHDCFSYLLYTLLLVFYLTKNPLELKWKHLWRHVGFHFL